MESLALAHQLERLWQLGEQLLTEFGIDMEKRHARDLIGTILPSVNCATLNDHVALIQRDFAVVEHENYVTLDHYGIVERLGAVHYRALATCPRRIDFDDAQ